MILLANSAKLHRAPEGRWKLAGGGAKRSHRYRSKKIVRVPAGTPDQNSPQDQFRSGALSGRVVLWRRIRRLRFAPPPANIFRASGAIVVCQQYQRCSRSTSSRTSGPVGRFGTRPRAESARRFGTYNTPSPAKCPSFNIITSAPELPD